MIIYINQRYLYFMGFFAKTAELLFKGALASYLLIYALNIKSWPDKWQKTISSNLVLIAPYANL